jgi:hypothetical protein
MISDARAKTTQTDIEMRRLYKRMAASYRHMEDLVRFIEFHVSTAYVENGHVGFHDESAQKDFRQITMDFSDGAPTSTP